MASKEILWSSSSDDKITLSATSFNGNQALQIASSQNKGIVARSKAITITTSHAPVKTAKINISQKRAVVTYELSLSPSLTVIPASGGTSIISATLKTYVNGSLHSTESVVPTITSSNAVFTVSGNKVTAPSRGGSLGRERQTTVTATYSNTYDRSQVSATVKIEQQKNVIVAVDLSSNPQDPTEKVFENVGAAHSYYASYPWIGFTSGYWVLNNGELAGWGTLTTSESWITITKDAQTPYFNMEVVSRGTTYGAARSLTLTYDLEGITSTYTVTQAENYITRAKPGGSTMDSSVAPTVTFTAGGGSNTLVFWGLYNSREWGRILAHSSQIVSKPSWLNVSIPAGNANFVAQAGSRGTTLGDALRDQLSYTVKGVATNDKPVSVTFNYTQSANTRSITGNRAYFNKRGGAWAGNNLELSPQGGQVGIGYQRQYTYSSGSSLYENYEIPSGDLSMLKSSVDWLTPRVMTINNVTYAGGFTFVKQSNVASERYGQGWIVYDGYTTNKVNFTQLSSVATTIGYGAITLSASYPKAAAGGGTYSPTVSYSQPRTQHYSNGNSAAIAALTSGGTVTYSKSEGSATLNTTTGAITVASRGTTVDSADTTPYKGTVSVAMNGKYASVTVTATQTRNQTTTITYGNVAIGGYRYASDITAGGGSVSPTLTYSQSRTQNYTSGATSALSALTSWGAISYSKKSGSGTINTATGFVTASSRGTTVGDRLDLGEFTVSITMNSKSSTANAHAYQAANFVTYGALTGGSVSAADIPAFGGDRTATVSNMSQTVSYTSGSTRNGTVTNSQTSKVSASSLGTTVKSRTKVGTITVTFTGEGSKTATKAVDVYQAENAVVRYDYGTWVISISASPSTIAAAGGTSTLSHSVIRTKTPVYTSGSTGTVGSESATATISGSATGFSRSGNTVTASANTWSETRSVIYTASYTGATSKSVTITQSAAAVSMAISPKSITFTQRADSSKSVTVTVNSAYSVKK